MKYPKVKGGEWQAPLKNYRMACCDCGLVHRMEFGIDSRNRLIFRAWRDKKETAALRKREGIRVRTVPRGRGRKK